MLLWIEFILCGIIIIFCGAKLSKYGDVIAEKTGFGGAWTGLILMASVTSLPELITGISAVTIAGVPDIAAGDLMGASVFNLLTLALLDPMDKGSPIFSKIGQSHVLSAGFGILMLGLVSVSILLGDIVPSLFNAGLYTPILIFTYIIAIRAIYYYERRAIVKIAKEVSEKLQYTHIPLKKAVVMYSLYAAIVISAAMALPFVAGRIASTTGLGDNFMGTFFVAGITTLPELAVSISAIRIGAADLAIGNLLGSNMFNMALLAIDDIFYMKGPLLKDISSMHATTGIMAMLMTAIALIGISYRPEKKAFLRFGWDSFTMAVIGVINMVLIYLKQGG
ncbi:MAG: sodium:calcium antiporter [Deltaproteobacteria bacterium]|nr:sodium:calcium antiporter [Deltaproteobacteria bacterium]